MFGRRRGARGAPCAADHRARPSRGVGCRPCPSGKELRMRGLRLVLLLAWVVAGVLSHPGAAAARRVALVVGNGAYRSAPALANPPNDARDVARSLRGLGFEVAEGIDLDKAGMEAALRRFAAALHGADVGLFYYSGHGLAVGDKNYLVPVDAQIDRASDLDFATVPLDLVTRVLDDEPRTALVFLDACRDNPLARSQPGCFPLGRRPGRARLHGCRDRHADRLRHPDGQHG